MKNYTPLVKIDIDGKTIWAKAEYTNISGSIKDRPIKYIIEKAISLGLLKKGDTIVEASSGNAGISFAMFCQMMGMGCVIVMPKNMSQERKDILSNYGAKLIEVQDGDFDEAIRLRDQLSKENGWYNGNQFHSPWNIEAHKTGTGVEIIYQMKNICKTPSVFVSGTGTGGTIMGAGVLLKEYFSGMKLVAVEPHESRVMSGGEPGLHGIQGIGDGSKFLVDLDVIDDIITIKTQEAKDFAKFLHTEKNIFVGFSAGANILATLRYLKQNNLDNGVSILCDSGDRYVSLWD